MKEIKRFISGYVIDNNGFIIDVVVIDLLDTSNKTPSNVITIAPPIDVILYKRKWNGKEWIEGATQEEIEEITRVDLIPPTTEERINALEEALLLMMMEG